MSRGTVVHVDLTVPDAAAAREFYATVVGWTPEPVDGDWVMYAPDGTPAAAICHTRGENADLPPQWLAYVEVADLAAAVAAVDGVGGAVVAGPKGTGPGAYVVVRDPAGAVLALVQESP